MTIIRPAQIEDESAIRTCAEAYEIYVPRIGRKPAPMLADFSRPIRAGHVHVLEWDGRIAGYAVFYERGDHIHLENIAVLPSMQGQGLGRALLRFVEDEAQRTTCIAVELYTNEKMIENLRLYRRMGYAETGRRQEDGFNRVYFRKEIE